VREELREDLDDAAANPGREVVGTIVLVTCGVGFLLRGVIHGTGWLAWFAPESESGATVTMDWGPVANPAVDATAAETWRLSLVVLVVGLGLIRFMSPAIDVASAGAVPLALAVLNVGVLVADPILVQVLPEGEA
jgi:hypothetical protein